MNALLRIVGFLRPNDMNNDSRGMTDEDNDRIDREFESVKADFDKTFYLSQNPDVASAELDPLRHFLIYGWKEGRDPNDSFSVNYYLECNPDVRSAGVNPFWHYVVAGKSEGRQPTAPSRKARAAAGDPVEERINAEREAIKDHFDAAFYLRHYSDVAEAQLDPLVHFLQFGWKEGRNPNAGFSVDYYLEANPDVRSAGVNPFWHYVIAGKAEGRDAYHPGGYRAEALIHTRPLEDMVKSWRDRPEPHALLSEVELHRLIMNARHGAGEMLFLSIGHDNYRQNPGGVQYCIQHEEDAANERGIVYLNLHPWQPLPRLSHAEEEPDICVSLLLDGEMIGVTSTSTVVAVVTRLTRKFDHVETVIHHLLGHNPEQIAELVKATGTGRCRLWLHDYFTLCPNYTLQRNNVSFCGGPDVTSNACTLCLSGAERVSHLKRMDAFFCDIEVDLIAPSQFAADFWSACTTLTPSSMTVLPHATIKWSQHDSLSTAEGRIKVAFVGYPAQHKGWPVFERIVRTFRGDSSEFEFFYFGITSIGLDQVERVPVRVTAEEPEAMIRALEKHQVDFVLHWASWGETFSFSTFEALTAGAYVITNESSGNVAATVRNLDRGVILKDEADLEDFFRDGRAQALAGELRQKRRTSRATMSRSEMTLEISMLGASK